VSTALLSPKTNDSCWNTGFSDDKLPVLMVGDHGVEQKMLWGTQLQTESECAE
jgi:hypothetical protein